MAASSDAALTVVYCLDERVDVRDILLQTFEEMIE